MLRLSLDRPSGRPLRVLAIGAHADDIELGCGGAILRFAREIDPLEVRWVVLSADGQRAQEARASAAVFLSGIPKANVEIHDFADTVLPAAFVDVKATVRRAVEQTDPDIVFCHRRDDLHQDHRLLGEIVWQVCRSHLILEYDIPKYEGDMSPADLYIPLSQSDVDAKVTTLLDKFPSQAGHDWFSEDVFRAVLRLRGIECHSPSGHAEAFTARKVVI